MGLMGLTAVLFLLSLGTYPVVEARLAALPYPAILLGLLLVLLLLNGLAGYRAVLSGYDKRILAASMLLASWLALVTAASSAAFGHAVDRQQYVGIGYIFAFPILALIFRHVKVAWLLWALLGGCVLAVSIGYIRFLTLGGGVPSEHALGYWGIRYLPSTRNSDVLYAIVSSLVATGLYAIARARLIRVMLMFIAIASLAAVMFSLSRSAWLAVSTGYLTLLWFTRHQDLAIRRRARTIGVIVFVGIVAVLGLNPNETDTGYDVVVDRMRSIADASDPSVSNRERMYLAMDAVDGLLRFPTGIGVGNAAYALGRPVSSVGSAENAWLTLGLEGGWLALAAFSLILLWLSLSIISIPYNRSITQDDLFSAIGMALLVAICSYLMFNYELNSLFLWSILAVVGAIQRRRSVAINRQDIGAYGGLQRAGYNRRGVALDSGADASSGRNNRCG